MRKWLIYFYYRTKYSYISSFKLQGIKKWFLIIAVLKLNNIYKQDVNDRSEMRTIVHKMWMMVHKMWMMVHDYLSYIDHFVFKESGNY